MENNVISVRGARVHNLKNIDIEIPKNKLITITGVSGSGKSSLAFDTIFAEGQRRYVESLSAYARQFLGVMDKPDVDQIDGLSPAIAIDQKTASHNPRSTVGTTTEIYDYLRLLFARIGYAFCYKCGRPIESQSVQEIVDSIKDLPKTCGKDLKLQILSPVIQSRKGTFEELFNTLSSKGFARVRVDNEMYNLDENIQLEKFKKHNIDVIVDRLVLRLNEVVTDEEHMRITDSVEAALRLSEGEIIVNILEEKRDIFYSERMSCRYCGISYPTIEPHTFSFNSPHGACTQCNGIGEIKKADSKLLYNPNLTISEGAIFPWSRNLDSSNYYIRLLNSVAKSHGFSLKTKMRDLSQEHLNIILYGSDKPIKASIDGSRFKGTYETKYEGVVPNIERRYSDTESDFMRKELEKYMRTEICSECNGTRLRNVARGVRVGGRNISEVSDMSIKKCMKWCESLIDEEKKYRSLEFPEKKYEEVLTLFGVKLEIARSILKEITERLNFLISVGLDYLSLNRNSRTLSGGESQRIRLASQIGSGLSGVLYVLDEPSIGLHQKDNHQLIKTLEKLKSLGNTVLVVEHDEETIRESDFIVDMGPTAGQNGGEIVASGNLEQIIKSKDSLTAPYLNGERVAGEEYINLKNKRDSRLSQSFIEIIGAEENNLKKVDAKFPIGCLSCVTGVSGSGKSTLVNEVLYKYTHNLFNRSNKKVGKVNKIKGIDLLKSVVNIDQTPLGRTPRSNPATYLGFFTDIRVLFANSKESKMRGYSPGRFSFNVKGGRCESCRGDGVIKIEMQFLPDLYVKCETCDGKRYNRETLEVQYKGKNIYEVLEMTVEEGIGFFSSHNKILKHLEILKDIGLGYIKIGQQSNTLSGGESQRIKLSSELTKRRTGTNLYILDEPTTGLHFFDIDKLLVVIHKLVEAGNTMIVIEHNLDIIKTADWLVDLGPEGGDRGGQIVVQGEVEKVMKCKDSWTGRYLKKILKS